MKRGRRCSGACARGVSWFGGALGAQLLPPAGTADGGEALSLLGTPRAWELGLWMGLSIANHIPPNPVPPRAVRVGGCLRNPLSGGWLCVEEQGRAEPREIHPWLRAATCDLAGSSSFPICAHVFSSGNDRLQYVQGRFKPAELTLQTLPRAGRVGRAQGPCY